MDVFNFPAVKSEIEAYLNSTERKWWQFRKPKYNNEEKAYGLAQLVNALRLNGLIK